METRSGLRSVLSNPAIYELWSRAVGGDRSRKTLVREYVQPWPGARVLDVGCGPGDFVRYLGHVHYVGVDASEVYIERARRLFGKRAEFRIGDATRLDEDLRGFDLVLAVGLVHHLDDGAAGCFWLAAAKALAPNGRVVAVDPTRTARQSRAARFLIDRDRGLHVRTPSAYGALSALAFLHVSTTVRTDLLRVPYDHCVVEART